MKVSLLETNLSSIDIFPEIILSNPAIDRKIVVFPLPDGPSNEIISPFETSKVMFFKHGFSLYD